MTVKLPSGESLDASELTDFATIVEAIETEVVSHGQALFAQVGQ